jgi:hypothetical protein
MDTNVILAILKLAAIMLSGILGVVGLLVSYKDKDGKVTKWGRRALIAVVTSSLVAALTQGVEVYKQRREASQADKRRQEENKTNNKLLTEISRAVYPLTDLSITASAYFPLTHPQLKSYLERLDRTAHICTQPPKPTLGQCAGLYPFTNIDENGRSTPIGVTTDPKSSVSPTESTDKLAWRTTAVFGIEVKIYKKPISRSEFDAQGLREADLHFRVRANETTLAYMFAKPRIEVYGKHMRVDSDDVNSNGSVTSITDLSGAQMFIYFYDHDTGEDGIDGPYLEIEQGAELQSMMLYVGSRKFPIEGFRKVANTKYPMYVYEFPANVERTTF